MNSHLGNIGADGRHFGSIILNKMQVIMRPPASCPPPILLMSLKGLGEWSRGTSLAQRWEEGEATVSWEECNDLPLRKMLGRNMRLWWHWISFWVRALCLYYVCACVSVCTLVQYECINYMMIDVACLTCFCQELLVFVVSVLYVWG